MKRRMSGERIFRKLSARLGKKCKGYIVAIEPKTGKYLIGKDELAVALKAKEAYSGKPFSFFRVGYPAVHKFRRR